MAVVVLREWTDNCFVKTFRQCAINRYEEADHYRLIRGGLEVDDPDSIEQRTLKIYDEADMAQFVEEHCRRKKEEKQRLDMYLMMLGEERVEKG